MITTDGVSKMARTKVPGSSGTFCAMEIGAIIIFLYFSVEEPEAPPDFRWGLYFDQAQ